MLFIRDSSFFPCHSPVFAFLFVCLFTMLAVVSQPVKRNSDSGTYYLVSNVKEILSDFYY